jgi:hypothetical protein
MITRQSLLLWIEARNFSSLSLIRHHAVSSLLEATHTFTHPHSTDSSLSFNSFTEAIWSPSLPTWRPPPCGVRYHRVPTQFKNKKWPFPD